MASVIQVTIDDGLKVKSDALFKDLGTDTTTAIRILRKRNYDMVTLTFIFNKDRIEKAGYTEDELLQPMREHSRKYGISEIENGVFSKDGEDALCVVGMFVTGITRSNLEYISYFDHWTLDVDGEKEDCIVETQKWYQKKGIRFASL